jgi:transcription antitermination factor NusG
MNNEKKWYAIYTKPRAEKKVSEALALKGFDYYLPLQTVLKQWSDRKKKVEEPLFKSYLFVHIPLSQNYHQVLGLAGVVKFVKVGKDFTPIRDEIIDAIRISLLHFKEIETINTNLKINQQVEVTAGPLKGYQGKTLQQHGNQYFALEIEELGSHMLIKIPAAYLSPLD